MDNIIVITISQIKNLKWGTGVTKLVSGLAGLQIPQPVLLTSTPPLPLSAETPLKTRGEMRKLSVGAVYVLIS